MWVFSGIAYYLGVVHSYLDGLAGKVLSIPLLGSYIASPIYWVGDVVAALQSWTGYASTWADEVGTQITGAVNYAIGLFNQATAAIASALSQAQGYARDLFNQVSGMITSRISSALTPLWASLGSLQGSLDQTRRDLWGGAWIVSLIGSITQDVLAEAARSFSSLEGVWISLVDQVLQMMRRQAARFSSTLWALLEEVLRALPGAPG